MPIVRVKKDRNYTTISNTIFRDKNLSLKSRGLLCTALSLPDNWQYSLRGLVSICKESETAIKSSMKELKENGYLEVTKERDERGLFEYVYTFCENPCNKNPPMENPPMENPPMENPPMENPPVENIVQLNNNKSSTELQSTELQSTDGLSTERKNVCPEPSQASEPTTEEPPVITLTLNTKEEYPIYQKDVSEWQELYPAVDVMQELRKMKGWLKANPSKRKTKSGIGRFINGWLSREQDRGPRTPYGNQTQQPQQTQYQSEADRIAHRFDVCKEWLESTQNEPENTDGQESILFGHIYN